MDRRDDLVDRPRTMGGLNSLLEVALHLASETHYPLGPCLSCTSCCFGIMHTDGGRAVQAGARGRGQEGYVRNQEAYQATSGSGIRVQGDL